MLTAIVQHSEELVAFITAWDFVAIENIKINPKEI